MSEDSEKVAQVRREEQKRFHLKIWTLIFMIAVLLSIGTIGYHNIEKHSLLDSLYFSLETLTTIGYGDLVPVTDSGKIFTIFYVIFGVGLMLYLISTLAGHYLSITQPHVERQLEKTFDAVSNIPEPKAVAKHIVGIPKKVRRPSHPKK